jgi:hypothetical protein
MLIKEFSVVFQVPVTPEDLLRTHCWPPCISLYNKNTTELHRTWSYLANELDTPI